MKTQTTAITDEQRLVSAHHYLGHPIPVYDDGFGPLWIHRDSMGISGIVRARTREDAYSICEDEFFPEAGDTIDEMEAEYATIYESGRDLWDHEHPDRPFHTLTEAERDAACRLPGRDVPFTRHFSEHPCWQEGYGFRPNGPNVRDKLKHGIYDKDLNGDALDRLTDALCQDLGITIEIEDYE